MTLLATAFTDLETLVWRLAVRARLGPDLAATPPALPAAGAASVTTRWEIALKRQIQDLLFSWPGPDEGTLADRAWRVADTLPVVERIAQAPSREERAALLDAWVEAGDAFVAQSLDAMARTEPETFAQWWEQVRLDRLLDEPEPTAHLVQHMASLVVSGAWAMADLARATRPWARSVGVPLLQPLWATVASTAATDPAPAVRAQAAACLDQAFLAARDADTEPGLPDGRWRWHLVSGLARGADTAAGAALLDRHVPLPSDETPLTPDHAARLLAESPPLLTRSAETLVALARRVPLPLLVDPTRFLPPRGTPAHTAAHDRAFAPLFALLGQAAVMAPMVREAIWQRATTADARVALLLAMKLAQRGPWWRDPVFARESFLALAATTAPDAVFLQEEVLQPLLAEQWGQVPLDLWLAVSLRSVPSVETWIETIAPRLAWGLPQGGAQTDDLLPLLQHADARVRIVGQSLLARVPSPPRVRR